MKKGTELTIMLAFLSLAWFGCSPSVQKTGNPNELATAILVSPTLTFVPITASQAPASLDDLQVVEKEAGFKIRLPLSLPKNYLYKSALYLPEQQGITVQYAWNDPKFSGEMLFFTQQKAPFADLAKEAVLTGVQLGSSSGVFVQGGDFDGKWEKEAPVFRLRFKTDDFYYTILFNGNERSSAGFLAKDEILKLAEQVE